MDTHRVNGMCEHALKDIYNWGVGNPSCVQNNVGKISEITKKAKKIGWVVSKTFALKPKHDKIWTQWALNILSKHMLKTVWWCKHFKMES